MEEALLARLRANLSSVVGTRNGRPAIDWIERGEVLPCITLENITEGRQYSHEGPTGLDLPVIQADCWAETYGAARLAARALRNLLEVSATQDGVVFNPAFQIAMRSMTPEDLGGGIKVFRISQDFEVWAQPA